MAQKHVRFAANWRSANIYVPRLAAGRARTRRHDEITGSAPTLNKRSHGPRALRPPRLADPNAAHTRDDRCRDKGADCDTRAPKTICREPIDAMRDEYHP